MKNMMKEEVIDYRGLDGSKISHILIKEFERINKIEKKYNKMKIGKTNREKNEEIEKLSNELETHLEQNEKLIKMNLELSKDERNLKRSAKRVLNFYESFRLKSLHLMDDEEIKESFDSLHELSEFVESE